MNINLWINGKQVTKEASDDTLLIDFLRDNGCYSVKRGCETSNCGLCTVILDDKLVLSCSTLLARADGKQVYTLEGLQEEAKVLGGMLADEGAEQCGFCSPGIVIGAIHMAKELKDPSDEAVNHYLAGSICRCSGYMGQLRGIRNYLKMKEGK